LRATSAPEENRDDAHPQVCFVFFCKSRDRARTTKIIIHAAKWGKEDNQTFKWVREEYQF
jgi:hypothetical protein